MSHLRRNVIAMVAPLIPWDSTPLVVRRVEHPVAKDGPIIARRGDKVLYITPPPQQE
jgi:hypothetical protein